MKKILCLILSLLMLFSFAGCQPADNGGNTGGGSIVGPGGSDAPDLPGEGGGDTTPDQGEDGDQGGDTTPDQPLPDNPDIQRYFTPVVKVSKSGLATWTNLEGATKFRYTINDGEPIETTTPSVQLQLNDVIKVQCVGDNIYRRDSRWTDYSRYIPAHSYLIDSNSQPTYTMNVYKEDGTVVLDTLSNTKAEGDIIQSGETYIFEMTITMGAYHTRLLMSGLENAVISDLTWSDKNYNNRTGEKTDKTDTLHEVKYDPYYNQFPYYGSMHRLHDFATTGEGSVYDWYIVSTPAANNGGVYDTRANGFWTQEPNWCSEFYGRHWLSTNKKTDAQMEAGYKYVRFKITYDKINTISTGNIAGGDSYYNLMGKEDFNFYAQVHCTKIFLFFNSDKAPDNQPKQTLRSISDQGLNSDMVNIYDAETGNVLLGNMADPTATGEILTTGKKYVFEFKATGDIDSPVFFTGVDYATITDVTWSNKLYSEKDGESAVTDGLRFVDCDFNHYLAKDTPMFHRIWKSGNAYTARFGTDLTAGSAGYNMNLYKVTYDDGNYHTCLTFGASDISTWFASKKTASETGKQYFRMTIEFNAFNVTDVGGPVTDTSSEQYGSLAATHFNMFVFNSYGGVYLDLASIVPKA